MIRWTDGLYGGLIAGVVSALFFLTAGVAVIHEPVLGGYFVDFAVAIFGSRIESVPIVGLLFGLFLHFLAAAVFGIFYAVMAARFKPAWAAPTSVLCGITYGFFMFFVAEDIMVPLLRVVSYTPAWEGLVGNVVFHGIIVSEYITIAHRRNLAGAA
jgi:uncharacterized membrane protein YagU involved in acid resistance